MSREETLIRGSSFETNDGAYNCDSHLSRYSFTGPDTESVCVQIPYIVFGSVS